ncbi:MAG: Gfo/Idh/MocA family oxidoreductase [Candidatus Bathyarchaeia archaeon]
MEVVERRDLEFLNYKIGEIKRRDYGIGVVGAGWVFHNYHMPAYRRAGFNVVAVSDIKDEALERAKKAWGIEKTFKDYREMLKLDEIDIVDIATPTFGRAQIVKDVAKAGKHMLVQKPFTRNYREGLEMVQAAEEAGVKLGVNSHHRWLYGFRAAHTLIKKGLIGEPFLIYTVMIGNQDYVYYHVMPERRWNAELDDFLTVEWGAHHFDYIRFWTGREPARVYYTGTKAPGQNFKSDMVCIISVDFPGSLRAAFVFNQVTQISEGKFEFRIEGTDGVIRGSYSWVELCEKRDPSRWLRWSFEGIPFEEQRDYSYIGTMGDLMNAITENREHISSGRDNLKTVRAYLAAKKSAMEGRPVSIEEII